MAIVLSPEVRVLTSFGALILLLLFPVRERRSVNWNGVFVIMLVILWSFDLLAIALHMPGVGFLSRLAMGSCLVLAYVSSWVRGDDGAKWHVWILRGLGLAPLVFSIGLLPATAVLEWITIALCVPPVLMMLTEASSTSWAARLYLIASVLAGFPFAAALAVADHYSPQPEVWRSTATAGACAVCIGLAVSTELFLAGCAVATVGLVRRNLPG